MSQQFRSSSRVFGATLLVSGCCIGAGMLGLPLVSLAPGFIPTSVMFLISWMFMALTGLLVLEVNLRLGTGINLMTMAEKTLGKTAKVAVAILFAFLFYCLLVAYVAGTGTLLQEFAENSLGLPFSEHFGSFLGVVIFGVAVYLGTKEVDTVNRLLMFGLALGYILLLSLGLPKICTANLTNTQWAIALPVLPAMIISFGYHNLIPSLTTYLNGNVKGLRIAILAGSFIPLCIYLLWELVFLGMVSCSPEKLEAIKGGAMVTDLFREASSSIWVNHAMQFFAFFAIVTSFLTVSMSFVDFVIDGLQLSKAAYGRAISCLIVFLPPFFFSLIYPNIFLTALNYAGAFGAVLLFGVLPVMMVWKGRYIDHSLEKAQVGGGKPLLVLLALFALFIFCMQLILELGL